MTSGIKLEGPLLARAERMLEDVCETLGRCGVRYCIDGGTLLGLHRESRLLPWDNDMDLYANIADLPRLAWASLRLMFKGYRVNFKTVQRDLPPLKKGRLRLIKVRQRLGSGAGNYLLVDIIIKTQVGDRTFWTVGKESTVLKSVESRYYAAFGTLAFKGFEYPTPQHLDDYLTARYGDWRTPVKEWDFLKDDQAIASAKPR
jgi:lipopolysaccharide cholinephosphotransferase